MPEPSTKDQLHGILVQLEKYKARADKALAQVRNENFFAPLDERSNSIAVLVKHMAGLMRSRCTTFLTSDGEKRWRQRDTEFEINEEDTRPVLIDRWEESWQLVFETVGSLDAEDLSRTVTIRGEPHTVIEAINHQLAHYAYHVGQIVLLAKHLEKGRWESLSIPRGQSEEVIRARREKRES